MLSYLNRTTFLPFITITFLNVCLLHYYNMSYYFTWWFFIAFLFSSCFYYELFVKRHLMSKFSLCKTYQEVEHKCSRNLATCILVTCIIFYFELLRLANKEQQQINKKLNYNLRTFKKL